MSTPKYPLLDPIRLGDIDLPNRIIMASMTRARTDNPDFIPNVLQAQYYAQRASAGLILTEGTWPNRDGVGFVNVPGLYTQAQADGWRRVTDAVHQAGGRIFVQLGHIGSSSHPDLLDGALPYAPSPVNPGLKAYTTAGFKDTVTPQAMDLSDIARTVDDYARAAHLAQSAGFDGVELHGISTYLIPTFLYEGLNQRTDDYGGTPDNRARFALEIIDALVNSWAPGRVGIKLSPGLTGVGKFIATAETLATFEHLIGQLSKRHLAYLQLMNPINDLTGTGVEILGQDVARHFRPLYSGTLIANGGYTFETGNALVRDGFADAVAFGAPFISNPDLVERYGNGLTISPSNRDTYYGGGAEGYVDYPSATELDGIR
ncbi:alkene reductase [Rhizobium sp. CECT 9324]|uniref:alkene reductase n=1 Tax=Rhizobium sp. CECT 9324 TaxID=2845820 RepID=UPI001E5B0145|nr:alkene reductase [Rhizobium sp. CECT 9324]CAH0342977.1 N-ethylmaleimide reductase [Rhizobium sp. CECT 9324]